MWVSEWPTWWWYLVFSSPLYMCHPQGHWLQELLLTIQASHHGIHTFRVNLHLHRKKEILIGLYNNILIEHLYSSHHGDFSELLLPPGWTLVLLWGMDMGHTWALQTKFPAEKQCSLKGIIWNFHQGHLDRFTVWKWALLLMVHLAMLSLHGHESTHPNSCVTGVFSSHRDKSRETAKRLS